MEKQAYKLKLSTRYSIRIIFHISLLNKNNKKKERVNKVLDIEPELNTGKNKKYKIEAIKNNAIYANVVIESQLPELYYCISWKKYREDENTWEPTSILIHFRKMINTFHENHLEKPTATFLLFNPVLLIAKPII